MGLDMWLRTDQEEIGYWRKDDALHREFLELVDDKELVKEKGYPLTKSDIENIFILVQNTINTCEFIQATNYLYSFYGDTLDVDYMDKKYLEKVKETRKILFKALKDQCQKKTTFYYSYWE